MTILHILYHYPNKCEVLEATTTLLSVAIFSKGSSQSFVCTIRIQPMFLEWVTLVGTDLWRNRWGGQVIYISCCFNRIKTRRFWCSRPDPGVGFLWRGRRGRRGAAPSSQLPVGTLPPPLLARVAVVVVCPWVGTSGANMQAPPPSRDEAFVLPCSHSTLQARWAEAERWHGSRHQRYFRSSPNSRSWLLPTRPLPPWFLEVKEQSPQLRLTWQRHLSSTVHASWGDFSGLGRLSWPCSLCRPPGFWRRRCPEWLRWTGRRAPAWTGSLHGARPAERSQGACTWSRKGLCKCWNVIRGTVKPAIYAAEGSRMVGWGLFLKQGYGLYPGAVPFFSEGTKHKGGSG